MAGTGFNRLKECLCSMYIIQALQVHGFSAVNYLASSTDCSFDLKHLMTEYFGFKITPELNPKSKIDVLIDDSFGISKRNIVFDSEWFLEGQLEEYLIQALALCILKSNSPATPVKIHLELDHFDTCDLITKALSAGILETEGQADIAHCICSLLNTDYNRKDLNPYV